MEMIELLITSGLCVLIWIIQILHYPAFLFVRRESFAQFEAFHVKRISIIVIPLMLGEALISLIHPRPVILTLVSLIWVTTFLLQVPCHEKLKRGFDEDTVRRLISTNWIRTMLWSIKLLILLEGMKWQIG